MTVTIHNYLCLAMSLIQCAGRLWQLFGSYLGMLSLRQYTALVEIVHPTIGQCRHIGSWQMNTPR